jgi:hypothetical protein
MSNYRKFWVALLGALVQLVAVLDAALEFDILPQSWRPWVVVVVGLATAAGVYQVKNEPRHAAQ